MFKKGQIVRSTRTGLLRLVLWDYGNGFSLTRNLTTERRYMMPSDEMTLIGNNYQAKSKCSH